MNKKKLERVLWGLAWYSNNNLGINDHIIHKNYLPALFTTKREARDFNKQNYGYIATRKDLRCSPFYWRMPRIVRIKVSVIDPQKEKDRWTLKD